MAGDLDTLRFLLSRQQIWQYSSREPHHAEPIRDSTCLRRNRLLRLADPAWSRIPRKSQAQHRGPRNAGNGRVVRRDRHSRRERANGRRSAREQSGRALLPSIAEPSTLPDWLSRFSGNGLMLDHRAEHSLASLPAPKDSLTLLVGPEGGLSEAERDLAMQNNFAAGRMGPRVLRTETAPLASLAAIQTLWGDFR